MIDPIYLAKLKEFENKFKFWKPGIYVYVEGGNIQDASADCDVDFNLFDNDNEKERTKLEPGEEPYQERIEMWNWMINSGIKDGTLKEIY